MYYLNNIYIILYIIQMTDNYQTKYLKYKFKYLNLLNQSAGSYTGKQFGIIFNNPNEDGYLIDIDENGNNILDKNGENKLVKDPMTLDKIHKDNAIYMDKEIYDANYLSKYIEKYYLNKIVSDYYVLARNPMNRAIYTEKDYNLIANHISGIDIDDGLFLTEKLINKRKEIINEIKNLIQLDEDIQKEILNLEPDQRKIFLNDLKFKIFIKFDNNIKIKLIYNIDLYKFITDEFKNFIIKIYNESIISNNELLFFIPEEYITDEIIKLHGLALKYVPKDKITFEICELAVKQNGLALEYVPNEIMTDNEYLTICVQAIFKNSSALKYVLIEKLTDEMTDKIIELAVKNNGSALKYAPKDKITDKIIELAVKNDGLALEFVPDNKKSQEIIKSAVQNDGFALKYVPDNKKSQEIIKSAVQNDGFALKYVLADNMTNDEYFEICKLAVQKTGLALKYVVADNMTNDEYYTICEIAVNQNFSVLNSVEKYQDKITKERYENLIEIAKKSPLYYDYYN